MKEIKELEEARERISKILFPYSDVKRQSDCDMIDQILNLKGKNWKMAIIDNSGKLPEMLQMKTRVGEELTKLILMEANFKQVIWEAE